MIKLFISYSHPDAKYVEAFMRFIVPLCKKHNVEIWYDRNITAGDDFWARIDEHLADRDIICLFISSHYLASSACNKEMMRAFNMKKTHSIAVVPIILSPCMWLENDNLKKHLALPTDGKPITEFDSEDTAWMDICSGIKPLIEKMGRQKDLKFTETHINFLKDASLFTKAHENKEILTMEDIFVSPELEYYNEEKDKKEIYNFDDVIRKFSIGAKMIIAGDDQSGKTTLAKVLIQKLRERNFIPIYLKDEEELLQGNLAYRLGQLFKEQYETELDLSAFDVEYIVPIVDDFHKAHKKELALKRLGKFKQLILVVDTIFDLEMYRKEDLMADFCRYRIKQFKPSLRNELIRKWISISDRVDTDADSINNDLAQIDERTNLINQTLGKTIGNGLMPAYPFFLLTLLSNYETLNNRINEDIASQGYYYQALIILFLTKEKVTNDKLDSYLNFLTELAYTIFHNNAALSQEQFNDFFVQYEKDFNMTDSRETMITKLKRSGIIKVTSLGNYDFDYPYLYYFFVGKYFSEHCDQRFNKNNTAIKEINNIFDNLHKNENAYITIFLVHHSKDQNLILEISKRADEMFKEFRPATLDKEELEFFRPNIIKQQIGEKKHNVAEERKKQMMIQDELEETKPLRDDSLDDDDDYGLSAQLRRSIKTVEVMGCIMRNRAGSSRTMLEELFEKGSNVHLRIISSFFVLVKHLIKKDDYDDFIKKRITEKNPNLTPVQVSQLSQNIFWNLNFGFILAIIDRITGSLGAKTLIGISDNVCKRMNTPASFVIMQEIAMRYQHNIRIGELNEKELSQFSPITRNVLFFFINQFCRYNRIDETDRQRLKRLGLNTDKMPLLPQKK